MSSYDFKLVLLGQGCVGKTSLVLRYVSNVFDDSHQSTLQASFLKKQLYLDANLIKLNIWDTAGQEKFHALGPIYYRGAHGALLVYDVTNPDSLRKVRDWIKELNKMLGRENIQLAIIGNKIDLVNHNVSHNNNNNTRNNADNSFSNSISLKPVTQPGSEQQSVANQQKQLLANALIQEADQLANELTNARHYLTSAKLNQGIAEMFVNIAKRMVDQHKRLLAIQDGRFSGMARSRILKSISVTQEDEEQSNTNGPVVSDRNSPRQSVDIASNRSCQC